MQPRLCDHQLAQLIHDIIKLTRRNADAFTGTGIGLRAARGNGLCRCLLCGRGRFRRADLRGRNRGGGGHGLGTHLSDLQRGIICKQENRFDRIAGVRGGQRDIPGKVGPFRIKGGQSRQIRRIKPDLGLTQCGEFGRQQIGAHPVAQRRRIRVKPD